MNHFSRILVIFTVVFSCIINAIPCGPYPLTPIFDYEHAPEDPFEKFAAGKIGIIKPTYRRSVLFAAYRYATGGGFTESEQKNLVEVWKAEFENKSFDAADTGDAVKNWVTKRQSVVGKDEKPPQIYVEREYGGYDFFPNCTSSAFETATETLKSRVAVYGSEDKNVKNWIAAQDQVFTNCASGKQIPDAVDASAPEWLQKDRAYQTAAAQFYSLDYEEAKNGFAQIALDYQSEWRETADYLVARTLIRQASLTKSDEKSDEYYRQAQDKLEYLISGGNKYAPSAEKLLGLVKYHLNPQERVRELGQKLTTQVGNDNLRQDLIDYNWLLDKLVKETLEKEEKRKAAENPKAEESNQTPDANTSAANSNSDSGRKNDSDLQISLYSEDYQQNWTFYVPNDATDDQAIAEAERVVGKPLSAELKKRVRDARQAAYQNGYSNNRKNEYEGGYYGEEKTSLSVLPDYLRYEDLTDWLFTYQIADDEAYLYSLSKYRRTNSDLWLMTALSKATPASSEVKVLLEAASRADRFAVVYPTIAYHHARILIEQGKAAEARKMLDEILSAPAEMPISTVNQFAILRLKLADTLDDYLLHSFRRPFAFEVDGESGSIEEIIAREKALYDPKYYENSRADYEREVDERFKDELEWQNRVMFDQATMDAVNRHFPLSVLAAAEQSPVLPDYLKQSAVIAVWTKAVLLDDQAVIQKFTPDLVKYHPEFEPLVEQIKLAKTPQAKRDATLYFILKNPILTPFIDDSLPRTDNETGQFDYNDWWCAPYEDEDTSADSLPPKPKFLTEAQSKTGIAERKKIKEMGDASKYLGTRVLEWARRAPTDPRIPESLFITAEANGWKKYGCGDNDELKAELETLLKKRYPKSEWANKPDESQ